MGVSVVLFGRDITFENVDKKWEPFREILESLSIDIVPLSQVQADDFYFAVEWDAKTFRLMRSKIPPQQRALVRVEPYCVNPFQYSTKVRKSFGRIISLSHDMGPTIVDQIWDGGHLPNRHTLSREAEESRYSVRSLGAVGMLNSNKFSAAPQSLYRHRYETLRKLAHNGVKVYLGGQSWDSGYLNQLRQFCFSSWQLIRTNELPRITELIPRSLSGISSVHFVERVNNSTKFFQQYEYGIAIENQLGYLTEKVFNVIRGGAIPLYFGANPEHFGVPKDTVVDVRNDFGGDFFKAYLCLEANPDLKSRIRNKGYEWIKSPAATSRWGVIEGQTKLGEIIDSWIKK